MLTIKCVRCRSKIFRYLKVGKGRLLHCWKDRIIKDFSTHDGNKIICQCGNLIGIDQGRWIKMRQKSFTYTGAKIKK